MRFEEILPELKKGKKIRRLGMKKDEYYFLDKSLLHLNCNCLCYKPCVSLSGTDLLADDWEVYKNHILLTDLINLVLKYANSINHLSIIKSNTSAEIQFDTTDNDCCNDRDKFLEEIHDYSHGINYTKYGEPVIRMHFLR